LNFSDSQSEHASHSTALDKADALKGTWSLTQEAFDTLLSRFSTDRDKAALEYEITRRKLVRFFQARSVETADEYADETINRVARRISEGQHVQNLGSYFYGVARMLFLEWLKERERAPLALDDAPQSLKQEAPEREEPDVLLTCFDRCLESLAPETRQLIIDYYQEERRAKIELRRKLADRLHIPLNALRIRAHRIRVHLESCVRTCLDAHEQQIARRSGH
jgi:DNA-directed RNA polymerase specialized sigma24 family protein